PKKEEPKKEPLIKKEPITKPAPKVEKKVGVAQNKQVSTTAKKKNIILPVAIIVVLVAAIAWSLFYFDVIENISKKYFAKTENKIVEVEKQKSGKTIEAIIDTKETTDTTVSAVGEEIEEKETAKIVEKKQSVKVQKFNVKKYYLVAGSFNIEANAKSFIDKLTSNGFTPEYIGERNGFYTVCYSSFDTEREAYNELERMKQKQIQTWVLHY
ncbi:MAG: SPOR domain-containing protein, partial [Bacteroidales bacterium]|nr:SPOR domain-containing protein [Bacteroidales bacterium]